MTVNTIKPLKTKIMQIKKNKPTPWTQSQNDQLKALADTAVKFMRHKYDLPLDEAVDGTLLQLQRGFPLVNPYLLLEASYFAIETHPRFTPLAKARATSEREACKSQRLTEYERLGLTFNV